MSHENNHQQAQMLRGTAWLTASNFISRLLGAIYIIGQLLAKNIDKDEIYNRVFHNYSTNALRLRATPQSPSSC